MNQDNNSLEHSIEETLNQALLDDFKKPEPAKEKNLKIPGVRKADGSPCCGGGCCFENTQKDDFKPELTKKQYLDIINQVLDPETGVGITDMGLIYDVEEEKDGTVNVTMTLTSLGCPAGGQITTEIDAMLRLQSHVTDVKIEIVWEPTWNPNMMNPEIKEMLFGSSDQIPFPQY